MALHLSEVHRILGEKLETNEIFRILQQLGFELMPERGGDPDFTVHIPSWRLDVEREIDLVEEIARLHGFDKFANTLPSYAGAVVEAPDAEKDNKLRASLLALGYDEAVSLTFISHEDAETFSSAAVIELANPQSEEASVMRSSLVPGMLNMLAYNLNRGADNVRLFEAGSVFEAAAGRDGRAQAHLHGRHQPTLRKRRKGGAPDDGGFFDLKGDVENLLHAFQYKSLPVRRADSGLLPSRPLGAGTDGWRYGGPVWTDPSRDRRGPQTAPERFYCGTLSRPALPAGPACGSLSAFAALSGGGT